MRIPLDRRTLAVAQGSYFALTGAWPLVSRRTFELVTGPKQDFWLVKTVGVLVTVMGAVMMAAGIRDCVSPEVHLLGQGTAAGFAIIDSYYVQQRRISRVYLLDALAEVLLLAGWAVLPDPAARSVPDGSRRSTRNRGGRARPRFLSARR